MPWGPLSIFRVIVSQLEFRGSPAPFIAQNYKLNCAKEGPARGLRKKKITGKKCVWKKLCWVEGVKGT